MPVELSHSRCDHMLGYCREMARTASSYAAYSEMLRNEKGRRKGTETVQRDKSLDGSRGKAPGIFNVLLYYVPWHPPNN